MHVIFFSTITRQLGRPSAFRDGIGPGSRLRVSAIIPVNGLRAAASGPNDVIYFFFSFDRFVLFFFFVDDPPSPRIGPRSRRTIARKKKVEKPTKEEGASRRPLSKFSIEFFFAPDFAFFFLREPPPRHGDYCRTSVRLFFIFGRFWRRRQLQQRPGRYHSRSRRSSHNRRYTFTIKRAREKPSYVHDDK